MLVLWLKSLNSGVGQQVQKDVMHTNKDGMFQIQGQGRFMDFILTTSPNVSYFLSFAHAKLLEKLLSAIKISGVNHISNDLSGK